MNVCVATTVFDPSNVYPVLDPRRTAGPGPYHYGYVLNWDAIQIDVRRTPSLSNCQMLVQLVATVTETKEIQAWNMFSNNFVNSISSSGGALATMTIRRAGAPGQSCGSGADTVVLCRDFSWPRGRTALYTFPPQDFWDFWGGCTVTFEWFNDTVTNGGKWGNQVPQPTYPLVQLPDGTLMVNATGTGFLVVFGGAGFVADNAFLNANFPDLSVAVPFDSSLPSTPADGTLLREMNQHQTFVVFGGARFAIPRFHLLRQTPFPFDPNAVRIIPQGGTAQLLTMPIDGTLVTEQTEQKVFLAANGQLRLVTSPSAMDMNCLASRHVRTVPNNTLASLPRGPDIT
jgi:hypothetical protein